MKIYFKEAISPDEFEYLQDDFDTVEYIHHKTEDYEEYREVMVNSEDIIMHSSYTREPFEMWLEWILGDWYLLYWDRLDLKYYLK